MHRREVRAVGSRRARNPARRRSVDHGRPAAATNHRRPLRTGGGPCER